MKVGIALHKKDGTMNLPTELQQIIKTPYTAQLPEHVKNRTIAVKKVFLLETDSQKSGMGTCKNCADIGWIYAFLSIGGPFKHLDSGHPVKWIDGAWYTGYLAGYPCPDCSGESMDHILDHEPALEGGQDKRATKDWTV